MKWLFLAASALTIGFSASAQSVKKVKIGEIEEIIQKSDHPVVISLWATWCLPCSHEIPYLHETVRKYQDKNVELVLVSLDFKGSFPSVIESFVKKNQYQASFNWLN